MKSTRQIIRENTFTFFNMVFVVLAVLLVIVGRFNDMTFLLIAVINTLIGIVQQIRSRNALAKLKVLAESRITVIRNDVPVEIPTDEIIKGDIAELSPVNLQSGLVTAVFLLLVPTVVRFFEKMFEIGGRWLDKFRGKLHRA